MHTKQLSPDMLKKYGHALTTLRLHLSDPVKAYNPDTLCAIYLMDVCQSWIGRKDDLLQGHGEVMAHLLNAAPVDKWKESFEVEMLVTICAVVAMESLANPKIQLDEFFTKLDNVHGTQYGPQRNSGENKVPFSITLPGLASIGKYFRDPELYLVEISAMYQESLLDYEMAQKRLMAAAKILTATRTPLEAYPVTKQYTATQAMVGLIGSIVLNMGNILRIFSPNDLTLSAEAAKVSTEMVLLAQDARQYRPLGSSYIPFCLVSAWAAVDGTSAQWEIENMLEEWQSDFQETRWINIAKWLRNGLEDLRLRLMFSQLGVLPGESVAVAQVAQVGGPNSCCIL
ncbi:hypothetical protein ONS95_004668 [Cadophora gregata]|nr:uncharacterized protein ONS95_004668 [Cadophora gregata]KAK0104374.1 hypothetical protein ONS95_004668 [Cadophora gregata]